MDVSVCQCLAPRWLRGLPQRKGKTSGGTVRRTSAGGARAARTTGSSPPRARRAARRRRLSLRQRPRARRACGAVGPRGSATSTATAPSSSIGASSPARREPCVRDRRSSEALALCGGCRRQAPEVMSQSRLCPCHDSRHRRAGGKTCVFEKLVEHAFGGYRGNRDSTGQRRLLVGLDVAWGCKQGALETPTLWNAFVDEVLAPA